MQPDEAKKDNSSAPGRRPPTTKVAALDLGSKTFKAVLGEIQGQRIVTRRLGKRQVGLGMDIANNGGLISEEKLAIAGAALTELKSICVREGSSEILAVATRALRIARNGEAILDSARGLGFAVEIASGEREAELAYLAATGGKPGKLVCELGSHSMQLASRGPGRSEFISIALGYERAYPDFIRDARYFKQARDAYTAFLERKVPKLEVRGDGLIGLSMNTMACFVTGKQKAQVTGRCLSHSCIREKLRALGALTTSEFTSLKAGTPNADKILSSLILLDHMFERTGHDRALIAESELPVGLIVEHFETSIRR